MNAVAAEPRALKAPSGKGYGNARYRQARGDDHEQPDLNEKDILKRHIARLEARIVELDAFAASVSHDLTAPLRAVASYATILEEDHGGEMSPAARGYLSKIGGATHEMRQIIDELLAFARFDHQPLTMSLVNTRTLVDHVLEQLERDDRIRCTVGVLGDCLGNVRLLQQVWQNLLSNAVKFTRKSNPALIEIGSMPRDNLVTYFVRDNGVGFDMSRARELFMPFRRLHDQRDYAGQGMGLAIAKRIVERHGGRMWVEATLAEGATFYFTLPRM